MVNWYGSERFPGYSIFNEVNSVGHPTGTYPSVLLNAFCHKKYKIYMAVVCVVFFHFPKCVLVHKESRVRLAP